MKILNLYAGLGAMLACDDITAIGVEIDESSCILAEARMRHWKRYRQFTEVKKDGPESRKTSDLTLF